MSGWILESPSGRRWQLGAVSSDGRPTDQAAAERVAAAFGWPIVARPTVHMFYLPVDALGCRLVPRPLCDASADDRITAVHADVTCGTCREIVSSSSTPTENRGE